MWNRFIKSSFGSSICFKWSVASCCVVGSNDGVELATFHVEAISVHCLVVEATSVHCSLIEAIR